MISMGGHRSYLCQCCCSHSLFVFTITRTDHFKGLPRGSCWNSDPVYINAWSTVCFSSSDAQAGKLRKQWEGWVRCEGDGTHWKRAGESIPPYTPLLKGVSYILRFRTFLLKFTTPWQRSGALLLQEVAPLLRSRPDPTVFTCTVLYSQYSTHIRNAPLFHGVPLRPPQSHPTHQRLQPSPCSRHPGIQFPKT